VSGIQLKGDAMPTSTGRARSVQQEQVPDPVTPFARRDSTAELGGEGGSYGDLTQSDRSRREWAAATEGQSTWRFAPAALIALLIVVAVILAVTFWAIGA
jgi:hypothetical protein